MSAVPERVRTLRKGGVASLPIPAVPDRMCRTADCGTGLITPVASYMIEVLQLLLYERERCGAARIKVDMSTITAMRSCTNAEIEHKS